MDHLDDPEAITLQAPFRAGAAPYCNHGEWVVTDITGTEVNLNDRRHAALVSAALNSYAGCDDTPVYRLVIPNQTIELFESLSAWVERMATKAPVERWALQTLRGDRWQTIERYPTPAGVFSD